MVHDGLGGNPALQTRGRSPDRSGRMRGLHSALTMPQTLRSIVGSGSAPTCGPLGWPIRALLAAIAIGGSCLYGASLSWTLPHWQVGDGAVWLALSAGLAWIVFIPVLALIAERPRGVSF